MNDRDEHDLTVQLTKLSGHVETGFETLSGRIDQLREQVVGSARERAAKVDGRLDLLTDAVSRGQKDQAVLSRDLDRVTEDLTKIAASLRDEIETRKAADVNVHNELEQQMTKLVNALEQERQHREDGDAQLARDLKEQLARKEAVANDRLARQRKLTWALGVLVTGLTIVTLAQSLIGG